MNNQHVMEFVTQKEEAQADKNSNKQKVKSGNVNNLIS